ncbi:MAG TPA: class I SAM-dependent methyltransferase [Desulfuromonadales bacterium]|nr:class I SAM-dependent methyltransferase [Desulfuromonadales bacterium]
MITPVAIERPALRGPVPLSHLLVRSCLRPGDTAIDATCGNGYDTLFLAESVGPDGQVWGFDIQQQAITETERRVTEAGLSARVSLIHDGHQNLLRHVTAPVQTVLFNLGYLPGGDRSIITRPDTTTPAMDQSLALLAPTGVLAITIYPGHSGGSDEQQTVERWANVLKPRHYHSWRMAQNNVAADAPYLLFVQKVA